jgi:GxxExxY protein
MKTDKILSELGLLESVYRKCLILEFQLCGLNYLSELVVPIDYKGMQVSAELKCDLVKEETLVLEIKAVDTFAPIHEAKLLTYMKLRQLSKGLLVNFNCTHIFKEDQKSTAKELCRQFTQD